MQLQKWRKPLLTAALAGAGLFLGFALLPLLLPFLLAYGAALAAEPAVAALGRKTRLPRWPAPGSASQGSFWGRG